MRFWNCSSGSVFQDDAGRGSSDRVSQTGSASLHLLPGAAGSSDQDERQRRQLLHLPDRHGQTDQEQGAPSGLIRTLYAGVWGPTEPRGNRVGAHFIWGGRQILFLHMGLATPLITNEGEIDTSSSCSRSINTPSPAGRTPSRSTGRSAGIQTWTFPSCI